MDDVEEGLRDLLTDEHLEVRIRPDAARLVRDGIRRRRRNRAALMAASTAVVTVVAIGGAVLTSGPGGFDTVEPGGDDRPPGQAPLVDQPTPGTEVTADNQVGWNPVAYDPAKAFALPGTTPDPSVPWCDAKDLTATEAGFQRASGMATGPVTVTNTGQTCAVQGSPSVTGYAGDKTVATPSVGDTFLVRPWIALQHGQSAQSSVDILGERSECLAAIDRLEVDLGRGGDALPVAATWPDGDGGQPRCGTVPQTQRLDRYVVSAGAWARPNGAPRLPMSELTATAGGAPSSVMQGTTVRYQVLLSTHGADLDPCPPFREQLVSLDGTRTAYATHYYLLDCEAIGNVDASTYRLDMELTMPGDPAVPPGDYRLEWQTAIPGVGDTDGPTVHVTAAPPACEQRQLDITPSDNGAAGGAYYDRVLITNTSARSCSLRGYPGVQFVDAAGVKLPTSAEHDTTRPYETIVLAPRGGVASFLVSGADSIPPDGDLPCPETKGLLIIAPNLVDQVLVPGVGMNCTGGSIRVFPVVAGDHAMP